MTVRLGLNPVMLQDVGEILLVIRAGHLAGHVERAHDDLVEVPAEGKIGAGGRAGVR